MGSTQGVDGAEVAKHNDRDKVGHLDPVLDPELTSCF